MKSPLQKTYNISILLQKFVEWQLTSAPDDWSGARGGAPGGECALGGRSSEPDKSSSFCRHDKEIVTTDKNFKLSYGGDYVFTLKSAITGANWYRCEP